MTEWWTYRPSDFLLFSARTYYRLFELHNAALWPAQLLTIGLGLLAWIALWRDRAGARRVVCALFGLAWLGVAWAFHWQRYAGINWAATWFAAAFAVQGLLLCWAAFGASEEGGARSRRKAGLALLLFALVAQPMLGVLIGRPWAQAELFGIAPDPTVLGTLGVLLMLSRKAWLWPVPLMWCAISGTTLATMGAADALVLPAAALLALAVALSRPFHIRRPCSRDPFQPNPGVTNDRAQPVSPPPADRQWRRRRRRVRRALDRDGQAPRVPRRMRRRSRLPDGRQPLRPDRPDQ